MARLNRAEARLPLGVALISASALAFEVLLLRLLTIVHWYQFAAMIIGLALLGYAAAGVIAALAAGKLEHRRGALMVGAAAGQAAGMPLLAAAIQWVPFNGLELVWDPSQGLWLALLFVVLALPFLGAGLVIVSAFQTRPESPGPIYAADLAGAAAGAWLAAAALVHLPPAAGFGCCALLAAAAGVALRSAAGRSRPAAAALGAAVAVAAVLWALGLPGLRISPYKGESLLLAVSGSELKLRDFGPDGYLAVVDNRRIPIRHAPGMSLTRGREPPPQLAVFRDGDSMTALTRNPGDAAWLSESVAAAPYALGASQRVAVLRAGTGTEVERALALGAAAVDAVEHRQALTGLAARTELGLEAPVYARPGVRLTGETARSWLARSEQRYDLVVYGTDDSLAASAAGVNAARGGYEYTAEAIAAAWRRLEPRGRLALTLWVKVPPRQSVKLAGAIDRALRAAGIAKPGGHVAAMRDWSVVCFIVSRAPLGAGDITALREFAAGRGFDLAWLPGLERSEANLRNRWREPWLYDMLRAVWAGDEATLADYPFDLTAPSDDRPWLFNAFRWRALPLLWAQRETGGLLLLESGYLLVAATLSVALLAGAALLALPLPWLLASPAPAIRLGPVAGFFGAIGLAFLGVEITLIEKLGLWLGRPLEAFAAGVAAFLIGAGLGSACSAALVRRLGARRLLALAAGALILWGIALAGGAAVLDGWILARSEPIRLAASVGLVIPAGFAMGQFFPAALAAIGAREKRLIPAAWAVNGAASVVASPLAVLLGIHLGLRGVLLIALALYAPALWCAGAIWRQQPQAA